MSFLTPFMLWGALAAGIPVAIHFFFRSRYRTVPWAAMKFLLTAVEQTSRRLRFQELLLLLLRMALLVLLAFAFARPISSAIKGSGRGEAVDAVFVFDLSYSMGATDGAKTRMERAQEEATRIIDELPSHSTVQIITSAGKMRDNVGPRSPGNLDQARQIVKDLELTHLATNLAGGVAEAEEAFRRGQASNKELYVFSDMQRQGFQADGDKLKSTLSDIKEKAVVHMVRCGTRTLKNAAIESIVPAAGVPRPGERVDFAIVVRNTGSEAMNNVRVTLTVDEDEKKLKAGEPVKAADKELETTIIPRLAGGVSHAVILSVKLAKPGLTVLTARIDHDDVPGDNRFDQVILVRDQVNILVVDGQPNLQDPERASSYFLMHAMLPVKETDRPTFKFNPRALAAGAASPADLKGVDICILANCSVQGGRATPLSTPFLDALDGFVREGHALMIFSGDNVKPDAYNRLLGQKYGLLPLPLKKVIKANTAEKKEIFFLNRDSFAKGPPAYWRFQEEDRYAILGATAVYQHIELDESALSGQKKQPKVDKEPSKGDEKEIPQALDAGYPQVILRLDNDKALIVSKKVDKGEVIFVGTSSQPEGKDPKTGLPNWTEFNTGPIVLLGKAIPPLVPFMDVTIAHLIRGQTQTYNVTAGQALSWEPRDKVDHVYNLVHPDQVSSTRLGLPERLDRVEEQDDEVKRKRESLNINRYRLAIADLPRAGVYRVLALPRGTESSDTTDPLEAIKKGTPIAVMPDPMETADLTTLTAEEIDGALGFAPIHIVAGEEAVSTGEERLNREWTVWALLALLLLVLCEVVLAWWCGRAW